MYVILIHIQLTGGDKIMPISMSNKVILITEVPRISTTIKLALNQVGLEIVSDYPALSSLSVMRTGIAKSGKTAFIRTELLRFINEKGFPRAIIMDGKINPTSVPDVTADMFKIFKTFLIAYIILRKGEQYSGLRGNIILLTKGSSFEKETGIGKNPPAVIDMLTTQNPEINILIDELKDSPERFNSLFSIHLLDTEQSSDVLRDSIVKFITKTEKGPDSGAVMHEEIHEAIDDTAENAAGKSEAARILYRIDAETVYDDGEITTELTEEHLSLNEKEFYIAGSWVSGNELEVAKKIASVILKGIEGKLRFNYNDEIRFNFDDRCIIDKNTTLSAAQLFTKNLSMYKKIKIIASAKNSGLMQKSRGFPMIKDIFSEKK